MDTTLTLITITPEVVEREVRARLAEEWLAYWPASHRAEVEAQQDELEAAWLQWLAEDDA